MEDQSKPSPPADTPPLREPVPASATDAIPVNPNPPASNRLLNRGYIALLGTQFFGAANDNILKQCLTFMIATGIWSGSLADGGLGEGGQVVPALLLTVPFIFLSGYAGQISDHYSKRKVMVWVKIAELPIAVVAFVGFYVGNLWVALLAMLLLAIQSSFFGPAKYGVIPELVAEKHLSMANGLINMLTNLAVIIGSLAAGPLSDLFNPKVRVEGDVVGEALLWAPGVTLLCVALLGLAASLALPRLNPANATLKFDWNPFGAYIDSVKVMAQGPLLAVVIAWAGFYMIAMLALMILPEYEEILDINYTKTSYLLGILGIAVAVGSLISGLISGKQIRPWLIPAGAVGMTISFSLLGLLPPTYLSVAVLIFAAGCSAGFYIVPLQALIQLLSPSDERGRIIGTSGAISFCFSSLGPVIFWVAANVGMPPNRIFLICGAMALVGTIVGIIQLSKITSKTSQSG